MSVVSVKARSFILALFIRDDGERFLLGDKGYDFKEKQLHFAGNSIENDVVANQGADGTLLAGQVRRASVQSFDGYVGDATNYALEIEQMRRDFIAFFAKNHHFRVIYIDVNRNAWQRKGGYLVDAPEVQELYQIHPEYHVGLNFEDVNYYSYDENAEGEEILSNLFDIPLSVAAEGGLVWDEDGAVSEDAELDEERGIVQTVSGNAISLDISESYGRLDSAQLKGNTVQNGTPTPDAPVAVKVVTGENVVKICGKNLLSDSLQSTITYSGTTSTINGDTWTVTKSGTGGISLNPRTDFLPVSIPAGTTVAFSSYPVSGTVSSSSTYFQIRCYWYDKDKNLLGNTSTAATSQNIMSQVWTGTYTPTTDVAYIKLGEYLPSSTGTTEGVEIHLQLELGSTATDFEPYREQSYEVGLSALGKNIFSSELESGTISGTTGENGASTTRIRSAGYMLTSANTVYTVSASASKALTAFAFFYNADKEFLGRNSSSFQSMPLTFTTIADTKYVRVVFAYSSGNIAPSEVTDTQLELGGSVTTYEPHEPIELCKIGTYRDKPFKNTPESEYYNSALTEGAWYVHKETAKYTFDSSGLSWDTGQGTGGYVLAYNPNSPFYHTISTGAASYQSFCSHFVLQRDGTTWTGNGKCGFNSSGAFWCVNSSQTTLANFLTWLGSAQPSVYYALATPVDEEITNEALIEQLEALSSASLKNGENNITNTAVAPNLAGDLEISYYGYDFKVIAGGYVWEDGGAGGPTKIISKSIGDVYPIWTVKGLNVNPQLENTTTGDIIEYIGTISEGQTLVIDMGEQTASLDGLNVVGNIVGDWLRIAPGENNIIYSSDTPDASASELGWSEIVG